MDIPRPEPGLVIRYGFLWPREAATGNETSRKVRPCAIVTTVNVVEGKTIVTVAPVTHARPAVAEEGVEIPEAVRRMLGLDDEPGWIIPHELNRFAWPGPDVDIISSSGKSMVYGRLPRRLLLLVLNSLIRAVRSGRARVVKRAE